jgi:hypothetical protein
MLATIFLGVGSGPGIGVHDEILSAAQPTNILVVARDPINLISLLRIMRGPSFYELIMDFD